MPTTSEGVSTVSPCPSLQGEELTLRLDLLRVSGRSDKQDSLDRGRAMPVQAWDPHLSPWAASLVCFRYISPTFLLGPRTFPCPAPSTSGCFWNQMWSKAGFQLGSLSTVYLKSSEPEVMPSLDKLVMTSTHSPPWLYQASIAKPGSLV